jgi:hypothetical protein
VSAKQSERDGTNRISQRLLFLCAGDGLVGHLLKPFSVAASVVNKVEVAVRIKTVQYAAARHCSGLRRSNTRRVLKFLTRNISQVSSYFPLITPSTSRAETRL